MNGIDKNVEIFMSVSSAITGKQFNEAHLNFIIENCKKFDAEEENKHEYYDIHKEYVQIVETIIEKQIKNVYAD